MKPNEISIAAFAPSYALPGIKITEINIETASPAAPTEVSVLKSLITIRSIAKSHTNAIRLLDKTAG